MDGKPVTDPADSFLARWSRRKRGHGEDTVPRSPTPAEAGPLPDASAAGAPLTDADMPPIESLGEDDDYSGFLSEGVSDALRRAALRRLFRSAKYNVTDGLDDYAEDFTTFVPLGDIVTADMKHRMERLVEKVLGEDGEGMPDQAATAGGSPPEEPSSGGAEAQGAAEGDGPEETDER